MVTQTTDHYNNTHHNSTAPDTINIRHLKHIEPLGLADLTNMYNIALNNNIIQTNLTPLSDSHNTYLSQYKVPVVEVARRTN